LTVYKSISLSDFLAKDNPYIVFMEFNKITISEEEKRYLELVKPPSELDYLIDDIQVLGRREIMHLLKWRSKINFLERKQKRT
jgi:AdoMet-dependent rRNA methyltransferase SPB1